MSNYYANFTSGAGGSHDGSSTNPFLTLQQIQDGTVEGDTVFCMGRLRHVGAAAVEFDHSLTFRQWEGQTPWGITGARDTITTALTQINSLADLWKVNLNSQFGATLDSGGAGTGVSLVGVDYYNRLHWTGARAGLIRRGLSIRTVVQNSVTAAAIVSNVVTFTVAHGYRVGDRVITTSFAKSHFNGTFTITAVTGTTAFSAALVHANDTDTTGKVDIDESVFFYATGSSTVETVSYVAGDLVLRVKGSGSTTPTSVDFVYGGGGSDYEALSFVGTGVRLTAFGAPFSDGLPTTSIDRICTRASQSGNGILLSFDAELEATGIRFDDNGDHHVFSGSGDSSSGGTNTHCVLNNCFLGALGKHDGDSGFVAYCYVGDISGQELNDCTFVRSISIGYDGIYNMKPLRSDSGATYINAMWAVTAHVNPVLGSFVANGGVIVNNPTIYDNPQSFNRTSGTNGFTVPPPFVIQIRAARRPDDRHDHETYAGQVNDLVLWDTPTIAPYEMGASTSFRRPRIYATGADRTEVQNIFNQSNGMMGPRSTETDSEANFEDGIIYTNGTAATPSSMITLGYDTNTKNIYGRMERVLFVMTGEQSNFGQFVDVGVRGALDYGQVTAQSGASITGANVFDAQKWASLRYEWGDVCFLNVGPNASSHVFIQEQNSRNLCMRDLLPVLAMSRCRIYGWTTTSFGASPISFLSKSSKWSTNQIEITQLARVGTTVTVTTTDAHSLRVGDLFAVSGAAVSTLNETGLVVATVTSKTAFTYTSATNHNDTDASGAIRISQYLEWNPGGLYTDPGLGTLFNTCSSLTRAGGVVTGVTSAAHNLSVGDRIAITGANEYDFCGAGFVVLSVADNTHFTYACPGTNGSATGTLRVTRLIYEHPDEVFQTEAEPGVPDGYVPDGTRWFRVNRPY